jgi:hypothetical protein
MRVGRGLLFATRSSWDGPKVSRVPMLIHERAPGDVGQKIPTD